MAQINSKSFEIIVSLLVVFLGSFTLASATSTFITQQGGTGTTSPSGILYGDNGSTSHLNTVTIGSNLTFSGGTLSASSGSASTTLLSDSNTFSGLNSFTNSGTTTFAGPIDMGNQVLTTHGLRGDATDGVHIVANNWANVASFGIANTQNSVFYGGVNIDGATRLATSLSGLLAANSGSVYQVSTTSMNASITGNAGTATALATPRAINGVNFDGTAAITITAASSTLLANSNTWSGLNSFSNSSTSLLTISGTQWITPLATAAGAFLAVDANGKVIATTTPSGGTSAVATSTNEVANQLAIFSSTSGTPATISGSTGLTWDGSLLHVNNVIGTSGQFLVYAADSQSGIAFNYTSYPKKIALWTDGTTFNAVLDGSQIASSNKILSIPNVTGTLGVGVSTTTSSLSYWGSNSGLYSVATSSLAVGTGLTSSGTLGAQVGGTASSISFAAIAANSLWVNATGASAVPTAVATSTLKIAISDTTGTLLVARGGTGQTTFTSSQLLYGNGTNALSSVATSSLAVGGSISSSGTLGAQIGGSATTLSLNMANANSWTALQTFANASSTLFSAGTGNSFNVFSNGNVGVASSSPFYSFSVGSGASAFYISTSTGKIVGYDSTNAWPGRISPTRSFGLSTGTTTTWTASTTNSGYSPCIVMPFAGTLRQMRPWTDASFLGVNVQVNGSNATPSYVVASTTIGTVPFTAGNTFTAGQKICANFGTTTTATTLQAGATFDVTETP